MTISSHPHPNPIRQRLLGVVVRFALVGVVFATLGLLILGFGFGLPLMVVMVPFLLGLSSPLLLLACLHPAIEVQAEGLSIQPLVFKPHQIAWGAIETMVEHSLIKPVPPKRQKFIRPQQGQMLLLERGSLPLQYRIIGLLAGHGFRPVIAISNRTHTDYETLRRTIQKAIQ